MSSFSSLSVTMAVVAGFVCGCTSKPQTPEQMVREKAAKRICEIRATPNMKVPEGAVKYYVSANGDDAADGRSEAKAWKSVARLNKEAIAKGAYVLFERGGVYRGQVKACAGVTYTAYGKGAKPQIYGSPVNGADPAKWEKTDVPNIWAYQIGGNDVGTMVFDDGAAHAVKVLIRTNRKTKEKTDLATGKPFNSYRDLQGDLRFWHDYYKDGTGKVYLHSEKNPGERFKSIEFNVKTCGFRVGDNADVTIDNMCVKYVGIHGISAGGFVKSLHVSNCEFGWIGGSIQGESIFGREHPTRLGNAVEIYGWCDDYKVENCYIWQVYDAGVTHQYNIPAKFGDKRCDQTNVLYRDNVFEKCCYSVEYFLTAEKGNLSLMDGVVVEDNLMLDAGYGFCVQRPDRGEAAHIKARFSPVRNRAKNYVVRRNAFCRSSVDLVQICSGLKNADGSSSLPKMEDNLFIGMAGDKFGSVSMTSGKPQPYGNDTQKFVDGFGTGNRCVVIYPER